MSNIGEWGYLNGMKQYGTEWYLGFYETRWLLLSLFKYHLMNGIKTVFNWLKTNLNDAWMVLFVSSLSGWDVSH